MSERKCRSCDGKGWLLDTTYDRSGEEIECNKCYGTGLSENQIYRALYEQRQRARAKQASAKRT